MFINTIYLSNTVIITDADNTNNIVSHGDAVWSLKYNDVVYHTGSAIKITVQDNTDIKDSNILYIELDDINGYWNDRHIIADNIKFKIDMSKQDHYVLAPVFKLCTNTNTIKENKMIDNINKNTFNSYIYYNKLTGMNETVTFSVSQSDVHIDDSWKITDTDTMKEILLYIRSLYTLSSHTDIYKDYVINICSIKDMTEEWCAHNLLYECFLFESHTKDVDITENNFIVKLGYKILSKIYKLIW